LALAEKSLQVSEVTNRTKPDVTIYQHTTQERHVISQGTAAAPVLSFALAETLEEEEYLSAVVIYRLEDNTPLGKPVTRIEILSPANKPGGSHYPRYTQKRLETLQAGLRLVELDYLHETPPILRNLPAYPAEKSYPYMIIVSDPRPHFEAGRVDVYGFGVLDMIPQVAIPLAGEDTYIFDFGNLYNRVFESLRMCQIVVDYEQEPVNWGKYNGEDQELIRQKMSSI